MVIKASSSTAAAKSNAPDELEMSEGQESTRSTKDITLHINSLKGIITNDRYNYIKERVEENRQKLCRTTSHTYSLLQTRQDVITDIDETPNLLTKKKEDLLCTLNGFDQLNGGIDNCVSHEDNPNTSTTVLSGNNYGGKNGLRPLKIPAMSPLPPYTTWVFLDRNQRMTEDQSVVGRRRIYYDQNCGEALICSDSEEETIENGEDKKDFTKNEDNVIRMTLQQTGLSDRVVDCLAQCLGRKASEIKARCDSILKEESPPDITKDEKCTTDLQIEGKDLDAALDSFDNLFCRRCLVFDCRLHGCSQDLIFPSEKQIPWSNHDGVPCGKHCYCLASMSESCAPLGSPEDERYQKKKCHENKESEVRSGEKSPPIQEFSIPSRPKLRRSSSLRKNKKRVADRVLSHLHKRQRKSSVSESDCIVGSNIPSKLIKGESSAQKKTLKPRAVRKQRNKKVTSAVKSTVDCVESKVESDTETVDGTTMQKEEVIDENICKHVTVGKTWSVIEKSLLEKGIDIFARNSCLIARNLLSGMKTCSEVYQYINFAENKARYNAGDQACSHPDGHTKGGEYRRRSKFLRRRGRVRRLKYTWKSAGYHSIRKRISEKKDQPCRQYTPCNCKFGCGKDCPCHLNGTCCEKYCGCSKTCKNRFRGCHCAKSQCRSRQCPCFAAGRECDPDVCRNCWVGCGDGTLGGPAQRGDNYECRNMKLLLKQQQRVLLGRSDVSGWGAFLRCSSSGWGR
ncbi:SET domain-containing protein isoform X2 [Wolffia australiana]